MTANSARSTVEQAITRTAHDWLLSVFHPRPAASGRCGQAPVPLPANHRVVTPTTAVQGLDFHPTSVKAARDFTASTLQDWGLARLCENTQLVVSELVTNACRHAAPHDATARRQPIQLCLVRHHSHAACMVIDPSSRVPTAVVTDPLAENGRGLHLIATFSDGWGCSVLDGWGKVVWAMFGIPDRS